MDITPFVESLRQDLTRAAEVGGAEMRGAADRLLVSLEPAIRLTLMEALSQAAAEISAEAPGIAVEVRLSGRDPTFAVLSNPAGPTANEGTDDTFEADDGEGVARITLRLPEALKTRAETQAARAGQSLNSWLIAAARAAAENDYPSRHERRHHSSKRVQGWAR
jgi:hypothetical protein